MGISSYSTTPADNTSLFPEGMARAQVNNSSRQVQADIRSWYETAEWVDYGYTPTYATTTSFTMSGNRTAFFIANRPIRCTDSSTLYGVVSSSSFSAGSTTVNVTLDSGSLSASLSAVALSIISGSNSIPRSYVTLTGTQTLTNKTLTSPVLTTPKFANGGYIADANGNRLLVLNTTASALTYLELTNGASGANPLITVSSDQSNQGLSIQAKGDGSLQLLGNSSFGGSIRLYEDTDNGSNYIGFRAPASVAANKMFILPSADGSRGQPLVTDASANLSFDGLTVAQRVSTFTGAVATGTTTIPLDDTIPQITEGDQYMTQAITPKHASNILVIEAIGHFANSAGANEFVMALFQDSTANALAVDCQYFPTTARMFRSHIRYVMTAGTTSSTTFRIRAGSDVAGTTTFNGEGGARKYGGVINSGITITEYTA